MAKTSMVEREKRRTATVKKYAVKRAALKAAIRSPKSSADERAAAVASLQKLPRDASPEPWTPSLRHHRPAPRRVSQVRIGPREDPRGREPGRAPRRVQGELVGAHAT